MDIDLRDTAIGRKTQAKTKTAFISAVEKTRYFIKKQPSSE